MIGLGVVGCGWAAGEIVRAAANIADLRVVAAYDTDAARAQALATKASARTASSLEALLADPAVDAVYVGLPHAFIPPAVEAALRAGKHVLAEKPLAIASDEARRLGALADAQHRKLGVFFELRRAGTVEAARGVIDRIGEPRLIRLRTLIDKRLDYWRTDGALNWRAKRATAGGGVVMMNSIHQLDTVRYLTGLDYASVSGEITTVTAPAGVDVEDTATASVTLSNGALLSLVASAHSPGAKNAETIEIEGTLGRIDLPDPFGDAPLRLFERKDGWTHISVERPDSHGLMLGAFIDAVVNDGPVPAGAADAAAALDVVTGLYRSTAERRVIALR